MGIFDFKRNENCYIPLQKTDLPPETDNSENYMIEKIFSYDRQSVGVLRVMLDERGEYINFFVDEMVNVNNISNEIKYSLNRQQYKHLNMKEGIPFSGCGILEKTGNIK